MLQGLVHILDRLGVLDCWREHDRDWTGRTAYEGQVDGPFGLCVTSRRYRWTSTDVFLFRDSGGCVMSSWVIANVGVMVFLSLFENVTQLQIGGFRRRLTS